MVSLLKRLVLRRVVGEEIIVRDERGELLLRLMVVDTEQSQVRLSFEAPEHIRINRAEIDRKIVAGIPAPRGVQG